MTDEELCKALRSALWGQGHHINIKAADRIEALTAERDAWKDQHAAEALGLHVQMQRAEAAEAKLAKALEALRKLHHAVCGETGFAACVRLDSGLAYPWPALDEADEMTRATLAEIEGEKT
jgi:hypothetical protein